MKVQSLARSVIMATALLGVSSTVFAAGEDPLYPLFQMEMMDKNKDGMVSKKEFMDMMSKAWDMKAKEMKVKGSNMTAEQIKELEKVLGRVLS
ncbi:EF-hand domain-containing protein [Piscinibacter sp.]|uniref:EF-hand domain-containing protein n=1 Tax=Piscinibacter sp. TaxID=1903157 RepID=UPI003559E991